MNLNNSNKQFRYILNPIFVLSLILLLSNDFFFKHQFDNWITGKLSDLSGIVVFVLFFSVFFKNKKSVFLVSALLFALWKSDLSQPFIDIWNRSGLFSIDRVIDFTDLFCLLILFPLFYFEPKEKVFSTYAVQKAVVYPLLMVSIFSITATSRAYRGFYSNDIFIGKTVKIKVPKPDFLEKFTDNNVDYSLDTTLVFDKYTIEKYMLKNLVLDKDTILETYIGIEEKKRKLIIDIERIKITEEDTVGYLVDFKDLERIGKEYGERIGDYLKALNK